MFLLPFWSHPSGFFQFLKIEEKDSEVTCSHEHTGFLKVSYSLKLEMTLMRGLHKVTQSQDVL